MGTWTFDSLVGADRTMHEELVRTQPAPAFSSICGWEWRGWNCLFPIAVPYMKVAGYQRFMKGFFRRAGEGEVDRAEVLHGYNIKVKRGAFNEPWNEPLKHGKPIRHSFYVVHRSGDGPRFGDYAQALMLDYNVRENGLFDGREIRDFVVEVEPDLLLGKAFFKLGPKTLPVSFFVLERSREHTFTR